VAAKGKIAKRPASKSSDVPLQRSAAVAPSKPRLLKVLGPGLITGASDDDPSGIATYSQAGAQFGYGMAWTMLVTYPLMAAVQEISARIGRTTGRGVAGNISQLYPAPIVYGLVSLLLIANVINIGANLGAMGEALGLMIGGPHILYVVGFAFACAALQVFLKYTRYVAVLKWMTLVLFAYVATLFVVNIDWHAMARGFLPLPTSSGDYWQMTVAILGTTISPYLFFWQASQEVEDIREKPRRQPLVRNPQQADRAYQRIRLDTLVGMALSNAVALAIMVTVAATLHQGGVTQIDSSAQAAEALKPIAGELAFILFALGIIGTGFLSVPVLAGSAAYAVGEAAHWKVGLSRKPAEARGFYGAIMIATLLGMALNVLQVSPITALYWSAVINGVVAVPIIVAMMLMTADKRIMGAFRVSGTLRTLGWLTAGAMGVAVLAMAATWIV
jgi:NRAMP (natural resistance-associated macrophage protein)-like metal ion transporter